MYKPLLERGLKQNEQPEGLVGDFFLIWLDLFNMQNCWVDYLTCVAGKRQWYIANCMCIPPVPSSCKGRYSTISATRTLTTYRFHQGWQSAFKVDGGRTARRKSMPKQPGACWGAVLSLMEFSIMTYMQGDLQFALLLCMNFKVF